jgi:hypothetical protein
MGESSSVEEENAQTEKAKNPKRTRIDFMKAP